MKKLGIWIFVLMLASLLCLSSCGDSKDSPKDQSCANVGHTLDKWITVTAPTCTERGMQRRECKNCDYYEEQSIDVTEHTYGDWVTVKKPTCIEQGEQQRACECGEFQTQIIEANGHAEVVDSAIAPTCTQAGLTEGKHCSVCSETLVMQETVDALGHNFGDWYMATEPTCTEMGKERQDCDNCDHYEERDVEAYGHVYALVIIDPTCTEEGRTRYRCRRCQYIYFDDYVEALGHDLSIVCAAQTPTCTKSGWNKYDACSRCDYSTKVEIPALGHTSVVDEGFSATCQYVGMTNGSHCSTCGATLIAQRPIQPLDHKFENGCCSMCDSDKWDGSTDTSWYNTSYRTFTLTTAEQLAGLARLVNEGTNFSGKTIQLGRNMYMNNHSWVPIGKTETGSKSFNGTFDGCGYTIESLNIKVTAVRRVGLFGYVNGGKLCNVVLKNALINSKYDNWEDLQVGLLVGYIEKGSITKCYVTGEIDASNADGSAFAGGLVGEARNSSISKCHAAVDVGVQANSHGKGGGLVGDFGGSTSGWAMLDWCSASGSVNVDADSTKGYAGGLIADVSYANISNSYATGQLYCYTYNNLVVADTNVGGLIGSAGNSKITSCYATGAVIGEAKGIVGWQTYIHAGGLVGNAVSSVTVSNCFASGDVNAKSSITSPEVYIGGLLATEFLGGTPQVHNSYYPSSQSLRYPDIDDIKLFTHGSEISLSDMTSASFNNKLKWDSTNWIFANGSYPEQRCFFDFYAVTIDVAPTCTEQGSGTKTCVVCGDKYGVVFDAFGHTWSRVIETPATLSSEGIMVYSCHCGENVRVTYDYYTEGLEIVKSKDKYIVRGYSGSDTMVVIPAIYYDPASPKGLPVNEIEDEAFNNCPSITSITIPNSITSVGANAFYNCYLNDVYITDLSAWCSIYFYHEFSTPMRWAKNLYLNGELVTDLVIPDSVTRIGNYAFYGCAQFTSITIPDSVTNIGVSAFSCCFGLTSVKIGNGVERIEAHAFERCTSMECITIPGNVTAIGGEAFSKCTRLTSVVMQEGVISISNNVFDGCSQLVSVLVPDSIQSIESNAFSNCSVVYNRYDNGYYLGNDNNPYAALIVTSSKSFSTCEIHPDTRLIANLAFYNGNCAGMTSISIPDSVTTIGRYAFAYCRGLTSVTIGNGVNRIAAKAFEGCTGLTSVTFKNTTGWWRTETSATSGTSITATSISNPATAAKYLTSTLVNYYWNRT